MSSPETAHPGRRLLDKLGVFFLLTTFPWLAVAGSSQWSQSQHPVTRAGGNAFVPYLLDQPQQLPSQALRRLLVVIHSSSYNAQSYAEAARKAAVAAGVSDQTLIFAPQFFKKNVFPAPIPNGMVHWRVSPFRGSSKAAVGPRSKSLSLSAYQVLDELLAFAIKPEHYPGLRDIVIFGHSAGGQFVQRYALVGRFEPPAGTKLRFVVSAPSSYAYPTPMRFDSASERWLLPSSSSCHEYHDWGYGLRRPYRYWKSADPKALLDRYATREVVYLCGSRDNNPNHRTLSKTCEARLQGLHRLERMQWFEKALQHTYGSALGSRHRFVVVPGLGHSGTKLMMTPYGRVALFTSVSEP